MNKQFNFSTFDTTKLMGLNQGGHFLLEFSHNHLPIQKLLQEATLKADFHALLELVGAKVLVVLMGRGGLRAKDSTRGSLNGKPPKFAG